MKNAIMTISLSVLLISTGISASASDKPSVPYYMYNAAQTFKIDIALMYAICKVESNCKAEAINKDDGNAAQKSRGLKDKSYGLFQIKAATAKALGFKTREIVTKVIVKKHKTVTVRVVIDHTSDLFKPEVNAWYAAKLLRHLFDKYKDTKKVISAYNAGKYIQSNHKYVTKVLNNYANYKMLRK